ncbi:hypothetical protein IHN32_04515 [Deinococcus sp. 14RED07]|uniref:hypothetical protein n=1 Tax=Deinococcus sp. 14RED07 TaxID=2745874 RepID=UPI001E2F8D8F|nr:hypothetical protein [Deinococcus sp. 14RED07]MCD0175211.1 hypothetical protein [Deinococcus sp. 14RED07]
MIRILMVVVALAAAVASAQSKAFTLTPARIAANEVKKVQDADFARSFNYLEVQKAYPYIGSKTIKGLPGNQVLRDRCLEYVRGTLKTPSVAKFVNVGTPRYYTDAGVYFVSGDVDSQNTYGAMIRSRFWCSMVFEGNAKGGILWIQSDVYSR